MISLSLGIESCKSKGQFLTVYKWNDVHDTWQRPLASIQKARNKWHRLFSSDKHDRSDSAPLFLPFAISGNRRSYLDRQVISKSPLYFSVPFLVLDVDSSHDPIVFQLIPTQSSVSPLEFCCRFFLPSFIGSIWMTMNMEIRLNNLQIFYGSHFQPIVFLIPSKL